MGNCSCVKNPEDSQIIFQKEIKLNQEELLNNIKSSLDESIIFVEPISFEEFEQILYSFPNVKELFEEYNSKIFEQSQKDFHSTNQPATIEIKEKDLVDLTNTI